MAQLKDIADQSWFWCIFPARAQSLLMHLAEAKTSRNEHLWVRYLGSADSIGSYSFSASEARTRARSHLGVLNVSLGISAASDLSNAASSREFVTSVNFAFRTRAMADLNPLRVGTVNFSTVLRCIRKSASSEIEACFGSVPHS